ncbi:MAG: uroporphyrinogen-III synthase [bacterium]
MAAKLHGLRILVPPSRLDRNPLVVMLERSGAEVVVFPELEGVSTDPAPLDEAAERVGEYDWIVFAGGASVAHFFERLARLGLTAADIRARLGAIGHAALAGLREQGAEVAYRPREHFAEGVAEGMLPVAGRRVLLIREAGASDALPRALTEQGARVEAVIGHQVRAKSDRARAQAAFARRIDLMTLANPATVRLFFEAAHSLSLKIERCLAGVPIACVGPATAEALRAFALEPDLVAGGRLKPLLDAILALVGE